MRVDLKVYPGVRFPAQGFALMAERFSTVKSVIISGCEITTANENKVTLEEGWALVRGRLVQIAGGDFGSSEIPDISGAPLHVMLSVSLTTGEANVDILNATDAAACTDTVDYNENNDGIAYLTLALIDSSWNVTRHVYDAGFVEEITIATNDWVEIEEGDPPVNTGTYRFVYSEPSITATSNQEILPPLQGEMSIADFKTMLKAIQVANIQDGGQTAGSMTLLCTGAKPAIDIKLRILYRGGNYI